MLANLEYCEDNDNDWDPAAKYGKKTGPASIATSSPGAPARAHKAMKKSCGVREGLANYNEQAEKDGGTVLGEHNKRTFVELAGTGPDGVRAVLRPKLPMFTETNKEDRFSMTKVINKGVKRKPLLHEGG